MKNKYHRTLVQSAVLSAALGGTAAYAGSVEMTVPAAPTPMEDVVSGSLNLDFSSHFYSYGNDVWNDGSDAFTMGFYPSAELAFALPAGFTATLGVWAEVHDKAPNANKLGGSLQEVDVWAGLSYTFDKLTVGVTYQNWIWGGGVEDILDVSFAYDTFLSPSLTIHQRIDAGGAAMNGLTGDEGTIAVLGLEHGIEAGLVSISFPFSLAYFLSDGFHVAGADSGFGYASIGVQASMPLSSVIGDAYGDWSLNAGVTAYFTDDDVIGAGVNVEDSFIATNIGLSLSF